MSIPVVINNYNRFTTTKQLYEDLNDLGYHNIYVLDNGSTYNKLKDWYYWNNIQLLGNGSNQGSLGIYNNGYLKKFKDQNHNWIVYTDSDIELNPNTHSGFIEEMIDTTEKHGFTKCGLALRIDDLPSDLPLTKKIQDWEIKYWKKEIEKNVFEAEVDTTFSCIRTTTPFDYKALRFAGNLTAKHIPWYTNFDKLSEEEKYYLDNVSEVYSGYKRYYNLHLNDKNIS